MKEGTRDTPPGAAKPDWTNPTAVMAWLGSLRVAVDDAAAVTEDLLRPLRRRDLGHREHRRLYREAKEKLAALLADAGGSDRPQD